MATKIITVEATPPSESTGADYNKGAPLNAAEFDQNIVNLRAAVDRKASLNNPTFTGTVTLPSTTSIGDVSATELQYLNSVTSNVQDQINAKAPIDNPTFTGTVTLPSTTSIGDVSATELQYLNSVTSNVQDQINAKAPINNPTFTGTVSLSTGTANGVLYLNGSKQVTSGSGLVFDSSGNLGIGTSSPVEKLQVDGGIITTGQFNGTSATGGSVILSFSGSEGLIFSLDPSVSWKTLDIGSARTTFSIFGSERMRLDSSGNLLVGKTSSGANNDGAQLFPSGTVGLGHASGTATNTAYAAFGYAGGGIGSITQNGTTGVSYNTASDYRLKEDIQTVATPIDRLNQLKPVNFAWKVDGSRCDGFLAHELQEVIPEAATGHKDEMRTEEYEVTPAIKDEEGNVITEAVMGEREVPVYQGIDQSKIVPLLTAALQEAVAKIESLTQRIEALEYTKQGE